MLGDTTRVAKLHARVMQIHQTIYSTADHGAALIAGLKCALGCLEIFNELMAAPFPRLDDAQRQLIKKHLTELELPLTTRRTAEHSTPG